MTFSGVNKKVRSVYREGCSGSVQGALPDEERRPLLGRVEECGQPATEFSERTCLVTFPSFPDSLGGTEPRRGLRLREPERSPAYSCTTQAPHLP